MKIDTEMVVFLPQNSKWFITLIFQGDKINKTYSQKKRLWIEILNKYFEETVEIKKNQPLGFLVIEPENLKLKYETAKKKTEYRPKEFINAPTEN